MILDVEEMKSQELHLLNLPREIRDTIYDVMFVVDGPLYPSKERAGVADYISLLRTNRQVYTEVVEVLYGRNMFQIRGTPAWTAPEFLNLLSSQRRDGFLRPSQWAVDMSKVCLARHYLKRLYIPSHNINLDRLKHLISLLKYFPNLEYLQVIYNGSFGVKDMDVINVCRLFRDRRPLVQGALCKRIRYSEAEDISWMLLEQPYRNWSSLPPDEKMPHMWRSQDGGLREAKVVPAPQRIPE
ncbi:hypothetical protein ONS95_008980 [Cadophora gregata]|uniref:uncharacterized protein n=1 Tax=Cadophora gregata TaxID=51156 RepID=UPI0026DB3164|nr:uncharacterized protein ONS95_008980 [Cadophora gregata]KAK0123991.1 hypothetical protein ONS95_008980 [Cadophora gregata]KAK0130330.1 hypothetical protein ONS96_000852 [Cadophora gregata f. sp. sojae]